MTTPPDQERGLLFEHDAHAAPAPDAGPGPGGPTPDRIMGLGHGYMMAKHLFVAIDAGLFEALGTEGATLEELGARCDIPARTARIVADALVSFGLLERDGDRYRNAADAEAFLTGRGPLDVRPVLRYFDKVSYPTWVDAALAVRTGQGVRGILDPSQTELYEAAVATTTAPGAAALLQAYDFAPHRRVLDVGGGVGTFLTPILARHQHLTGTLLELPEVADTVRARLARGPVADRVEVVGADMFVDPLPDDGFDAILVAHLLHLYPPDRDQALLDRLRLIVADGGRLLLLDWWLDPAKPHLNTIFGAGEFLMVSGGDTYTVEEVDGWLRATGWRLVEQVPLVPPMGLLIAEPI